ncbi:hypothetical protein BDV96DRAFT_640236 [Lophiotrema nucula]|uniref:Uncharacterized protein n=1 Tax=Lophiotrema nucula TaxID=690887 RepID=A0A6A5ZR59_9PLEO|nr:hypothetical protein BDV96DRAFT_640236 [Lophiotrema nucula]
MLLHPSTAPSSGLVGDTTVLLLLVACIFLFVARGFRAGIEYSDYLTLATLVIVWYQRRPGVVHVLLDKGTEG